MKASLIDFFFFWHLLRERKTILREFPRRLGEEERNKRYITEPITEITNHIRIVIEFRHHGLVTPSTGVR